MPALLIDPMNDTESLHFTDTPNRPPETNTVTQTGETGHQGQTQLTMEFTKQTTCNVYPLY